MIGIIEIQGDNFYLRDEWLKKYVELILDARLREKNIEMEYRLDMMRLDFMVESKKYRKMNRKDRKEVFLLIRIL